MKMHVLVVGALSTNCYIVEDETTHEAVIIDPGEEPRRIAAYVDANALKIRYILVTHGHMDHIWAVADLVEQYDCPIVMHKNEIKYMQSEIVKRSPYSSKVFDQFLKLAAEGELIEDGAVITAGALEFKAIEVPGHTSHSLCYYMESEKTVWVGDTLFRGGVGRTDFYEGGVWDLLYFIKDRLLTLPEEVCVWPGHGPGTTIGEERQANPYMQMLGL